MSDSSSLEMVEMIAFLTFSSQWTLDTEGLVMTRLPRNEKPSHPTLPYSKVGAPRAFEYAHIVSIGAFNHLCVHCENGYWTQSGNLLEFPSDFVSCGQEVPCDSIWVRK